MDNTLTSISPIILMPSIQNIGLCSCFSVKEQPRIMDSNFLIGVFCGNVMIKIRQNELHLVPNSYAASDWEKILVYEWDRAGQTCLRQAIVYGNDETIVGVLKLYQQHSKALVQVLNTSNLDEHPSRLGRLRDILSNPEYKFSIDFLGIFLNQGIFTQNTLQSRGVCWLKKRKPFQSPIL